MRLVHLLVSEATTLDPRFAELDSASPWPTAVRWKRPFDREDVGYLMRQGLYRAEMVRTGRLVALYVGTYADRD